MRGFVPVILVLFSLFSAVSYGHKTFTVFNDIKEPFYYQVSVKGCHMWNLPGGATVVHGSGERVYMFRATLAAGDDSGAIDLTTPDGIDSCGVWVRVCASNKAKSQEDCTSAKQSCYMDSTLWSTGGWTNFKNKTNKDAPFKCTTGHPYHFEIKPK